MRGADCPTEKAQKPDFVVELYGTPRFLLSKLFSSSFANLIVFE